MLNSGNNALMKSNDEDFFSFKAGKTDIYLDSQLGKFSLAVSSNDDPFAEVEKQYGIPNKKQDVGHVGYGLNANVSKSNNDGIIKKPIADDPFDDLL